MGEWVQQKVYYDDDDQGEHHPVPCVLPIVTLVFEVGGR